LLHAILIIGLNNVTRYLNNDWPISVAATDINAVVAAVVIIVVVGIGTSMSVNGIPTNCASGGKGGVIGIIGCLEGALLLVLLSGALSSVLIPLIPGGGLRVLGGATKGL
tara:strand:+ start:190 stop:519 length:330 start_codon:yes stop_codon:yes gene_type:complete